MTTTGSPFWDLVADLVGIAIGSLALTGIIWFGCNALLWKIISKPMERFKVSIILSFLLFFVFTAYKGSLGLNILPKYLIAFVVWFGVSYYRMKRKGYQV